MNRKILCCFPMLEGQADDVRRWLDGVGGRYGIFPVMLPTADWNDDLTPWPAGPVFRKGKSFGGGAERYLSELESKVLPSVEADLGFIPDERWFVGVSLAGLFGIWAAARSPIFTRTASVSGSFWYPGFTEWLSGQTIHARSVYLSLGDREAETRNPHLCRIAAQTETVREILGSKNIPTKFEWTEGTHFSPLIPRLEKALTSMILQ